MYEEASRNGQNRVMENSGTHGKQRVKGNTKGVSDVFNCLLSKQLKKIPLLDKVKYSK